MNQTRPNEEADVIRCFSRDHRSGYAVFQTRQIRCFAPIVVVPLPKTKPYQIPCPPKGSAPVQPIPACTRHEGRATTPWNYLCCGSQILSRIGTADQCNCLRIIRRDSYCPMCSNDDASVRTILIPSSALPLLQRQVCRQSFMSVSNDAMLATHVTNKHGGKKTPAECFPGRLS